MRSPLLPARRRVVLVGAIAAFATLSAHPAQAVNTWDGGGANGNWSTLLNWDTDGLPNFPTGLTFGGTTNLLTNNDLTALTVGGITFDAAAGAFTLGGNAVTLTGGITDNSAGGNVINLPLSIGGATAVSVGAGALTIGPGAGGSGIISGIGGLTKSGLGTLTLGAVNNYTGLTVLNGGTLQFTASQPDVRGLQFGGAVNSPNVSTLDLTGVDLTTTSLLVQTNSATANTINLGPARTLTVNGAFTVGPNINGLNTSGVNTLLTATGGGNLVVNGAANHFVVGTTRPNADSGTDPVATLDLTGLNSFTFTGTTGELRVGWGGNVGGTLRLAAATNTITTPIVQIGATNGGNPGALSTLSLGPGTNVLRANTFNIGFSKGPGSLTFQSPDGSVNITGLAGGASTANITVGNASSATATSVTSQLLLAGHQATVQAGTVIIGQLAGSSGGNALGNVTFDTGTFTVNNLQLGVNSSGTAANGATGTFTLGGLLPNNTATGVLTVNNQFFLANRTNTNLTSPANGNFIINGGTAIINTDILDGSAAANTGPRTTTLTLAGGLLNLTGHNIGSATQPITNVNFTGGTLMNVNAINGTGGVNMTGLDTVLILDGTNNYTGSTTISSGTLQVGRGANSGTLGSGAIVNESVLVFNRTGTLTVPQAISGAGSVQLIGGGTIVLGGANTYTGATQVSGGTLSVTGSIPGAINLASGGTLTGTGDGLTTGKVGEVTMAAGSTLRAGASGAAGDGGTLTLAGLTVNGGTLAVDLGPSGDLIKVAGTANFTGASTISPDPSAPAGTYTILNAVSLLLGSMPTVAAPANTRKSFTADFSTANTIKLIVVGSSKALTWTGQNGGVWDVGNAGTLNWTDGTIAERFFSADSVLFGNGPANRNVTINATMLPSSVTVNNAAGNDYSFSGAGGIGGGGSLIKSGAGALTLATANSYTGGTTLNAGTLNVNDASALGSGALIIAGGVLDNTSVAPVVLSTANPQTWNADVTFTGTQSLNLGAGAVTMEADRVVTVNANTLAVGGPIAGAGALTKAGSGTLVLGGANSFTGGATLNAGTLHLNHATALGSGVFTIAGGTLDNTSGAPVTLAGNPLNFNGDFTFLGSNSLNFGNGVVSMTAPRTITVAASNLAIGGVISGSFALTKEGAGSLTLAGVNTYSAPTQINAGTIIVTNNASLGALPGGAVTISAGGALDFSGNTTANQLNFGAKVFNIAGSGVNGTGALTNSGTVGQQNALQQVFLTADATVGGTGRFDIRATTSALGLAGHTLTKTGPSQFTLVGTNVSDGSIVVNQGIFAMETTTSLLDFATGHTITYNNGTTAQFFNLTGPVQRPMIVNGAVTMGNASTATQPSTVGSPITLNGDLTVTNLNNSAGALTLNGNITETGGARTITKTGATALTLAGTTTLSGATTVNAGSVTITGTLAGSGAVNVNAATLAVPGSLTSSGAVNVNTGGTLTVTGTQAATSALNVNSGGTLVGFGTGGVGNVTLATGSSLRPGATISDASIGTLKLNSLTVNGGDLRFNLLGTGTSDQLAVTNGVIFNGASTISPTAGGTGNYVLIAAGSPIDYGAGGVNKPTVNFAADPNARTVSYALDNTTTPSQLLLNVVGGAKTITWTGLTDGSWSLKDNTRNNWKDEANAPEQFFSNDTVVFGDGPATRDVILAGTMQPGSVVVNNSTGNNYTITGVAIGGGATLLKSGTGALTLDAANTYTGGTTLSAGTLNVNGVAALGTGPLTITGGTLDNTSFQSLVMTANNPQNWNGDFTFLGSNNLSLGTGAVTLNADRTVSVTAGELAVGGVIGGGFALTKAGPGALRLSGVNTYTAPTTISAGTVIVTNAAGAASSLGATAGGAVNITAGATLDLSGNSTAQQLNFGAKRFNVVGNGVGGVGAIVNNGVSQFNSLQNVTLTGNTTFGGSVRFDIRPVAATTPNAVFDLAGHTFTKQGANQFSVVGAAISDGEIVVNEGTFGLEATTTAADFGSGKKITFNSGTTALFFNLTGAVTRPMVLNDAVTMGNSSGLTQPSTVASNITLNGDLTVTNLNNSAGGLILTGNIVQTGGPRSLSKFGPSALTLGGTVTYSGNTNVEGGTLLVSGSLNGTAAVNVGASATLGGSGTITTAGGNIVLSSGAFLAPGLTAGTLTLATGAGQLDATALTLGSGGFRFDLGTTSDRVALTAGALNIGNGELNLDDFTFTNSGGFGPGTYTLFDTNAPIAGGLGAALSGDVLGFQATLAFANSQNDLVLVVVPEPGAAACLLGGFGSLLGFGRRRRKA